MALTGLGGIGKTLTAVEYAYRHRKDYQAIFCVTADDTFNAALVALASLLEEPEKDAPEQNVMAVARRWLEEHTNWLLVLDNVEDLSLIRQFAPLTGKGHILFTTLARGSEPSNGSPNLSALAK